MPQPYTPATDAAFPTYPISIVANGDVNEAETWNAASRRIIDGLQNLRVQGDLLNNRGTTSRRRNNLNFEFFLHNKVLLEAMQGISFPLTGVFTFTLSSDTVTATGANFSVQIRPHTYIFPVGAYADRTRVLRVVTTTSLQLEHLYRGATATNVSAHRLGPVFTFFEDFRDLSKRHVSSTATIDTTLQVAFGGSAGGFYVAVSTASESCSRVKLLWNSVGTVTARVNLTGDLTTFVTIADKDTWTTLGTAGTSPVVRFDLAAGAELYDVIFLAIP